MFYFQRLSCSLLICVILTLEVGVFASEPTVNVFKDIDANNDLRLSREEMKKYVLKNIEEAGETEAVDIEEIKKFMEDHDKLVEEIFSLEDKNEDGFISHSEFSGPKHDEF